MVPVFLCFLLAAVPTQALHRETAAFTRRATPWPLPTNASSLDRTLHCKTTSAGGLKKLISELDPAQLATRLQKIPAGKLAEQFHKLGPKAMGDLMAKVAVDPERFKAMVSKLNSKALMDVVQTLKPEGLDKLVGDVQPHVLADMIVKLPGNGVELLVGKLEAKDLGEMLKGFNHEEMRKVVESMDADVLADVFEKADPAGLVHMASALTSTRMHDAFAELKKQGRAQDSAVAEVMAKIAEVRGAAFAEIVEKFDAASLQLIFEDAAAGQSLAGGLVGNKGALEQLRGRVSELTGEAQKNLSDVLAAADAYNSRKPGARAASVDGLLRRLLKLGKAAAKGVLRELH